ncbi:hypothetical protein [Solibacillus sp. CAU 1738]|uniref:hypothetical protein n=1 Tax=Solibacillus sp. CAU 1738 TaxID=3140363 RepID=UPI003260BB96
MIDQASGKHLFLVLGLSLLFFSPILILIIPTMIPMTLYFEKYTWVYYTLGESYLVFGFGLATLIVCCAILFLGKLKKWAVSVGIILTVLACFLFYGSAVGFIAFADEGITYRGIFENEKKFFGWDEIGHVKIEQLVRGTPPEITFTLKDGEVLSFTENGHVRDIRGSMRAKFQKYNIPMEHTYAD